MPLPQSQEVRDKEMRDPDSDPIRELRLTSPASKREVVDDLLVKLRTWNEANVEQMEGYMREVLEVQLGVSPFFVRGPSNHASMKPCIQEEHYEAGVASLKRRLSSPSRVLVDGSTKSQSMKLSLQRHLDATVNGADGTPKPSAVELEDTTEAVPQTHVAQPASPNGEGDVPLTRKNVSMTSTGSSTKKKNSKKLQLVGRKLKQDSTPKSYLELAVPDSEMHWLHDKITGQHADRLPKSFDLVMGGIIVVNTMVMFAQLEWQGRRAAANYGFNNGRSSYGAEFWGNMFDILEHIFTWIYISELVLRLGVWRTAFFRDWTNLLDMFVVLVTFADVYVLDMISLAGGSESSDSGSDNLGVVKVLRLARMARALRFVRILKLFPALRVLVRTIAVSVGSLVWSMVILFIFGIVSAMILCQTVQDFIGDTSLSDDTRKWVDNYYGTSTKAAWSVFELTMSGCWPNYSSVLIHDVSSWYAAFFALYVAMVVFAVIRIITALFLKDTLQVAASDAESIVAAKMKQRMDYTKKLAGFFREADTSNDGQISKEEFIQVLSIKEVRAYLSALEIETNEVEGLYQLLSDDNTGAISFQSFLDGVFRMKGQARSMDVVALSMDCKKILERSDKLVELLQEAFADEDGSTSYALQSTKNSANGGGSMLNGRTDSAENVNGRPPSDVWV